MCIRDSDWTIHFTKGHIVGETVGIRFEPDDIHIMNKMFKDATNFLEGEVIEENTVTFLGISFKRENLPFSIGDKVRLEISPDNIKVVSLDHGDLKVYLESLIYKGAYNEMIVYSMEHDTELILHSMLDEQVATDIGIQFDFPNIVIAPLKGQTEV